MQPNCSPFEQLQFRSDVTKRKTLSFELLQWPAYTQKLCERCHVESKLTQSFLVDPATCAPAVVVIVDTAAAVVVAAALLLLLLLLSLLWLLLQLLS